LTNQGESPKINSFERLNPMLIIELNQIPPEGLEVAAPLSSGALHVEGEENFALLEGGTLECRLDRGDDHSVHVRGHLSARLELQCGRCLEAYPFEVEQELDLFYLPHRPEQEDEEEDEVELGDRDMVVAYYQGERLDLGEMIREQFFLAVPMKRLCRDACAGICPTCGANRNARRCECPPAETAGRLAGLGAAFEPRRGPKSSS
jgi:DUF177 domain-containing protein